MAVGRTSISGSQGKPEFFVKTVHPWSGGQSIPAGASSYNMYSFTTEGILVGISINFVFSTYKAPSVSDWYGKYMTVSIVSPSLTFNIPEKVRAEINSEGAWGFCYWDIAHPLVNLSGLTIPKGSNASIRLDTTQFSPLTTDSSTKIHLHYLK